MVTDKVKRKLTAIFSADVEGYSRLMGEDEIATIETLTSHKEIMGMLIRQFRGRVVDSTGDNLLAEFGSVVDSVQCAVEVQQILGQKNEILPENRRMYFRIGINLGDVVEEGDRIYGDGVNIAARIESLAEAGGICISGSAFEQIENKLALGYQFMGEHSVKNIFKPIKVYKVPMEPEAMVAGAKKKGSSMPLWRRKGVRAGAAIILVLIVGVAVWNFYLRPPPIEPVSVGNTAFPLPEKPSIAVLPFINVGGDQRQEYFSDGITDDLITDLSKISGLFVIARNSVFTYKNKPMMVQCIAEQLGVRYLLEGSVRKAGDQIRINAQLIDATMGHHLWADRYDGNINDVFALQDKVTQKIVAALAVKLTEAEEEKVVRQETDNIKAYDFFLKGWEHYCQWTPEDFRDAIPYFERAIELDSHYGRAYAALASTYLETWQRQWDWPRVIGLSMDACFSEAGKYLQEAMKNPTSLAHRVASKRYIHLLYYEEAIDEARRAIAVDPNGANGYAAMAEALIYSGKPEEAVDFIKKAMRLDPHNLANHLYILGLAHFGMEQFQKAASSFERSFNLNPKMGSLERAYLAVAYLYLGQIEKAKAELDRPEIEDRGNYDLWVRNRARYKYPKDRARLLDGLSKVGME